VPNTREINFQMMERNFAANWAARTKSPPAIRFLPDHSESIKLVSVVGDICDPASIEHAFQDVTCVFHCAANINFQFPTATDELERVNVHGNVVILMAINF
jgi:FlaA1/EpsC-like NDP-sugar epimerase